MKSKEDLTQFSAEELQDKLEEARHEYDNLLVQKATHQLANPLRVRFVRREIARIKTIIHQHELGINVKKSENA